MKESNFYSDEFEDLIRGKTEQYKMYPSENVWKGVHNSLHTKRKWFIGSMALLVTGILYLSGKELIAPSRPTTIKRPALAGSVTADLSKATTAEDSPRSTFVRLHQNISATAAVRHTAEA